MLLASDLPAWAVRGLAFVFGALWGSFFNVAIYRWPRDMSVVTPPSHCPSCKAPIPAWRNVPILGFIVLRGRAACCGARLSPRYLVVETLSALLCVALAERFVVHADHGASLVGTSLETVVYFALIGALVIATFVDLEWMEIPDEVSLPGAALGLATASLRSEPGADAAALGAGGGFLIVQVLFVWTYERLTGRRGMGEGDAKLLMLIGAFLGWQGALFALVAGAMQGLVVALGVILSGRSPTVVPPPVETDETDHTEPSEPSEKEQDAPVAPAGAGQIKVPFGPFLALGAVEFLFFGDAILRAYTGLFD